MSDGMAKLLRETENYYSSKILIIDGVCNQQLLYDEFSPNWNIQELNKFT